VGSDIRYRSASVQVEPGRGRAQALRVDYELTKRVLAEFERHHVDYVVFGAVAVNLQGLARATEGLDVFITPQRENVERLGGVSVTVATPATLYRMKKGTIRPKDWGDAETLRRRFRLPEE
jgi:hypothetical protein